MLDLPETISRRVRTLLIVGVLALATAGFAAFQLVSGSRGFHGTPYPDTPLAPAFELTDHTGEAARLEDFNGSATLLFFGFASCPDVCPLTLAKLSRIVGSEGSPASETDIVLVTVDPENDTPDRLANYVTGFGPSVTGLTGTPETIRQVMSDYGVYAEPGTQAAMHSSDAAAAQHGGDHAPSAAVTAVPPIIHTPVVFGIDRNGRLQVIIHPDQREEIVRDDIRTLAALE